MGSTGSLYHVDTQMNTSSVPVLLLTSVQTYQNDLQDGRSNRVHCKPKPPRTATLHFTSPCHGWECVPCIHIPQFVSMHFPKDWEGGENSPDQLPSLTAVPSNLKWTRICNCTKAIQIEIAEEGYSDTLINNSSGLYNFFMVFSLAKDQRCTSHYC